MKDIAWILFLAKEIRIFLNSIDRAASRFFTDSVSGWLRRDLIERPSPL